jgi:hypothetical protein
VRGAAAADARAAVGIDLAGLEQQQVHAGIVPGTAGAANGPVVRPPRWPRTRLGGAPRHGTAVALNPTGPAIR